MKKLTDTKFLAGKEETISLSELRQQPGEVFSQVQLGMTFHITLRGKKIATVSPPEMNALELGAALRKPPRAGRSERR